MPYTELPILLLVLATSTTTSASTSSSSVYKGVVYARNLKSTQMLEASFLGRRSSLDT